MQKNIFRFFIGTFILLFILFNFNFTKASDDPDIIAPVITLIGDSTISININDEYIDAGASALDDIDGDITPLIITTNNVDSSVAGEYRVFYNVSDLSGNEALQIERQIIVKEDNIIIPIENVFIRNGENILFDGIIDLPESGSLNILDNQGENHEIDSRSVLAILYSISNQENAPFTISNLVYYPSFNSFYLKCLMTKEGEELCDNWQYIVNRTTPQTGIDQTILSGNESLGLYFGTSHKLSLDKNEIKEGGIIKASSFKYNYLDNIWEILSDINIDVTILNVDDPWNPILISKTPVDENGLATIILENEGIYTFGISEDYSFPSYQVVVNKLSGSSGGGGLVLPREDDLFIEKAISFLSSNKINFLDNPLYTDWVSIGIAQTNDSNFKNELKNYLKDLEFSSSIITDYERHAMALMSLGINPYTGTNTNYIEKIVSSFDGNSIGNNSLYTDDIFALIILSHAGFNKNDEIISKVVSYLISKQSPDGSWDNVDITSASIQALYNFKNLSGVKNSISKAEQYLKQIQNQDGSFGNSYSTSWAIQALSQNSLFSSEINEALNYLYNQQQTDGGLEDINTNISSRIWSTSYAIPAMLLLSWNDILESFDKNEEEREEIIKDDNMVEILEEEKIEKENILEEIVLEKEIIPEIIEKINNKNNKDKLKIEEKNKLETNLLGANALLSQKEITPSFHFSFIDRIRSFLFIIYSLFSFFSF